MERDDPFPNSSGEIGKRIGLIADLFQSRTEAAAVAGVSVLSLRRYIAGEQNPPFVALSKLALAKQVSLAWLATGEGAMFDDQVRSAAAEPSPCVDTTGKAVDLEEFVFIPRYNVKAAAGHGAWPEDESPRFSMAFRRYWIEHYLRVDPAQLSVIPVKGDSMEGVLNDRDVILINHADAEAMNGVYVLRIDGHLVVKRVQRLPGNLLEVKSANEAYTPFTIDLARQTDDFAVIGRVVWFGRQIA
ncbi:helix-turn-helix transcriptional regulator [Neisseriaceae bacterium JH1-16]|nr:helix-turn-helix transcriptional regulator [Neisseriaceae bacterium JH1-16]